MEMESLDRVWSRPLLRITCLELSFTSLFRDSSLGSPESENAFHQVLLVQPTAPGSSKYYRLGAEIVHSDLGLFGDSLKEEFCII